MWYNDDNKKGRKGKRMSPFAIGILLCLAGVFIHQLEAIIVKNYGKKHGKGGMFFSAFLCLFAVLYYVVSDLIFDKSGFQCPLSVFWLGLANSALYALGFYAGYVAYASGSFGLTRFYSSFGGVLTIVYGLTVLGETTGPLFWPAVVLKFLAMFLIQYKAQKRCDAKFTPKWFFWIVVNTLSNVALSIVNKYQQDRFDGLYRNEYLTVIFVCSTLVLFLFGFLYERHSFKQTVKYGLVYGMVAGLCNGVNNVLSLAVYHYLNISFVSPFKGGLGMLAAFIIAGLIYKEKFTVRQYIGAAVAVASVVLINIK